MLFSYLANEKYFIAWFLQLLADFYRFELNYHRGELNRCASKNRSGTELRSKISPVAYNQLNGKSSAEEFIKHAQNGKQNSGIHDRRSDKTARSLQLDVQGAEQNYHSKNFKGILRTQLLCS